jgi:competence protein ComEC
MSLINNNLIPLILLVLSLDLQRRLLINILIGAIFSLIIFTIYFNGINSELEQHYGREIISSAIVYEDPDYGEYSQKLVLKIEDLQGLAITEAPKYPSIAIGDQIIIEGILEEPSNLDNFDYKSYLKSKKILYDFQGDIEIKNKRQNLLLDFKESIARDIKNNLSEPGASLLIGILLGSKNSFSDRFEESLKVSGLSHIVSVSGYNFSIIFLTLTSLLISVVNRKWSYIISVGFMSIFLILVGIYNLPALRAFIMITLITICKLIGRKVNVLNILYLTILWMLFDYPWYLNNVSFLLSIGATLGLFLFAEKIKKKINRTGVVVDSLSTSLAVTISVLPISLLSFEEYYLTGIISNLFILPFIPILTFLGFLAILFNILNIVWLKILIFILLEFILKVCVEIINIFGAFISFKLTTSTLLYLVIIILIILLIRKTYENYKKNT